MNRTADLLATIERFNSTGTMQKAALLSTSFTGAAARLNALGEYSGLLGPQNQLRGVLTTHDLVLREAQKLADAQQVRERFSGLFSDTSAGMDRYLRMVSDAGGPLSTLRSMALFESETIYAARHAAGLMDQLRPSIAVDTLSAIERLQKQQQLLASSFGESLAGRWLSSARDIAEQFAGAKQVIDRQSRWWRDSSLPDPAQLLRTYGLPVMDPASLAAVAQASGFDGLLAQLRSFGIDDATIRSVASAVTDSQEELEELVGNSALSQEAPRQLTQAQLMRLWNLFFVLYSLLMPVYALWDTSQSEIRITGEIRAADERAAQRSDAVTKLMEQILEVAQREVLPQESLVVQARVVSIRSDPRHGASLVAEAFPNQVVTILDERGKWVKVEYYDWLAQDERSGWALKKYFVRAGPRAVKTPSHPDL